MYASVIRSRQSCKQVDAFSWAGYFSKVLTVCIDYAGAGKPDNGVGIAGGC